MLWIGMYVHGSSSQDACDSRWGTGDDVLASGLKDGVVLGPNGKVPQHTQIHGSGRDLTFLTPLQVSEYIRIQTKTHDMYMTRSRCWLTDERTGNRGSRGG